MSHDDPCPSHWIPLAPLPKGCNHHRTFVTKSNFIINITPCNKPNFGIYVYNELKNKWIFHNKSHKLFDNIGTSIKDVQYDKQNDTTFIIDDNDEKILKITDIISNDCSVSYIQSDDYGINISNSELIHSIITNSQYHYFLGRNNRHVYKRNGRGMMDDPNVEHEILHIDYQQNKFKHHEQIFCLEKEDFGLIYIPNNNALLLIGGKWWNCGDGCFYFDECISKLSLNDTYPDWIDLNVKLPLEMTSFGLVMSNNDQKNIFIFGGNCDTISMANLDDIYIFNLETMTIKKLQIKCPVKSSFYAVVISNTMYDKIIITGFIRKLYMTHVITEIVGIILNFCKHEEIHLFNKTNHWKISLDIIHNKH
eukprot:346947_1